MDHLCDYEVLSDTSEVTIEVCKKCHRRIFIRKDKRGRVDNDVYRVEHKRDLLQPVGETANLYKKEYGSI